MQIKGELFVNLEGAVHSNLKPTLHQRSLDCKNNNRAAFLFPSSTVRRDSLLCHNHTVKGKDVYIIMLSSNINEYFLFNLS